MMIPLSQILSVRRLLMFGGKKQQRHITTINITQPAQKLGSKLAGLKVSTSPQFRCWSPIKAFLCIRTKRCPFARNSGSVTGTDPGLTLDKSLDQH